MPSFKPLQWQNTQRKQEQLVSDLGAPVRLHPCGVVLNIASETPDQPTYSLRVAATVKGFGHISRTERYILEIPLPFNNQPHLKTYIKNYQEKLAKQSLEPYLALVYIAYYLFKVLHNLTYPSIHIMNALFLVV